MTGNRQPSPGPLPTHPTGTTLPTLKVALLGCGTVGTQVARLLTEQADDLALRVGARLELAGIAVRRVGHRRAEGIDRALLTADAHALVSRPDVDIVVEVIGGIEPARSLLLAALKNGKSVVTANKALLAENGAESAPPKVYRFPGALCISVNEEAIHGIPGARRLRDAD